MAILGITDMGDGRSVVSVDHDPTITATDCRAGSLIIIQSSGVWYRKRDDGSTVNVELASLTSGGVQSGDVGGGAIISGNIASGQISWANLSSGVIRSGHVGNNAVNSGSIASGQIFQFHLSSGTVNSGQVGDNSISSGAIVSGQIGWAHLSSGAVNSGHIGNAAVVSGSIASGSIGSVHLSSGCVVSGEIGNAAVVSGSIASGSIGSVHLSSGAIKNATSGVIIELSQNTAFVFRTGELISGSKIVSIASGSDYLVIAGANNVARMPAIGYVPNNFTSGQLATVYTQGPISGTPYNFSGYVGKSLYVDGSGEITGKSILNTSGHTIIQSVGVANSTSGFIADFDLVSDSQYVEDDTDSTTTGNTYLTKLTLTTPALIGVYLLQCTMECSSSTNNRDIQIRLQDTTTPQTLNESDVRIANANAYYTFSAFKEILFNGTPLTFTLNYRRSGAATTATVRRARMILRRIG